MADQRIDSVHFRVCASLLFEYALLRGLFRLLNQLLIFALLLVALGLSGDPSAQRGIYNNIVESFDLEALAAIRSREAFVAMLPVISQASKKYFSLSSEYFDSGQDGAVQMIGDLKSFSNPELVGGFSLTVEAPEISFSSWVRISQDFVSGYLVRKRPVSAGTSSSRSCWGWYLHRTHGQALHFGAHDFFPTSAELRKRRPAQVQVRSS
jgi:hypothetical protein